MASTQDLADARQSAAVVLCSDAVPLVPMATVTDVLQRDAPGVPVVEVVDLCRPFSGFARALEQLQPSRAVVACASARPRRDRILEALRASGVHPTGAQLVELVPVPSARAGDMAGHALARLRAALARVNGADLTVPARERAAPLRSNRMSRRDLLRLGRLPRRPVAAWAPERCRGHGPSRPCGLACPKGALSLGGGAINVDEAACTGCGACVAACRSGAISLCGASLSGLEAAARLLVEEAGKLGAGVEIRCQFAEGGTPLGGQWLPLEVPSMDMVSAGWVFQLLAFGAPVRLTGCADGDCAARARELARFAGEAVGAVAAGGPRRRRPARLTLREPEATVEALSGLASVGAGPWRLVSSVAPMGEVGLEASSCSLCGTCALACPAGALRLAEAEEARGGVRSLLFDASRCAACGTCLKSCPEGAISLARAVTPLSLGGGPKTLTSARQPRCSSCGALLNSGPPVGPLLARLAVTHPEVARRLQSEQCPDCLLVGS